MRILTITGLHAVLSRMQWQRGLRTGLAVGAAMLVCRLLGRPMGWAALGGLYVCLVDNGGPYRTRLANILTVTLGGALCVLLGSIAGIHLPVALLATLLVCFCLTLARVISQPMAASSVLILICFIVSLGATEHTFANGLLGSLEFLLGGMWAAALALALWPVDPFRPARDAVAAAYAALLELSAALPSTPDPANATHFNELLAHTRLRIESAQSALAATPARQTARTVRARNLTVLTETADFLIARILRFAELGKTSSAVSATLLQPGLLQQGLLQQIGAWLTASLEPIEQALRHRPVSPGAEFDSEGSRAVDLHRSAAVLETAVKADRNFSPEARSHLVTALRDSLFNLEIAFQSVRAVWTGAETPQRHFPTAPSSAATDVAAVPPTWATRLATANQSWMKVPRAGLETLRGWLEIARSNLTLRSVMARHALRLSFVVTLDVFLARFIHVTHGYWLAMTSLIVLRPFAGETVSRSMQRVAGTVAGGVLAAGFTAIFSSSTELLLLVVVCSAACVALYAVDYAWYCFFVTPAIVLLTLPKLHDWHLAAVRGEMTLLGAVISVLAMLLLWPERESLQLPGLLARAAAADAAYLRAMLAFWQSSRNSPPAARLDAERNVLAPARRLCGLAVNDAEETLDHALLEHSIPLNPRRGPTASLNSASLTFTTYLRRLTQAITLLAAVGEQPQPERSVVAGLALRLDAAAALLNARNPSPPAHAQTPTTPSGSQLLDALPDTFAVQQLRRLDRQVGILERTASDLATIPH
jgi:uncharacterized membrane protein YccC